MYKSRRPSKSNLLSFEAYSSIPFQSLSLSLTLLSSTIMVAIDRVGHVYPSVHLQEMLKLAQKPAPLATPTPASDPFASIVTGDSTQKVSPSQFGLDPNNPSLQFATPGGGFVQVFGPLKTPGNDKFFFDPNPVVIQKKSKPVTYVQKINLAYYKPPAPPAPGPVIIKEVRRTPDESISTLFLFSSPL